MELTLLAGIAIAAGIVLVLQIALVIRRPQTEFATLLLKFETLEKIQERTDRLLREEFCRNRDEMALSAKASREELAAALKVFNETLSGQVTALTANTDKRMESLREIVDARLKSMQEENSKQLNAMRQTVDEKLQSTLEKRLGESFKMVSERLEQVHKGLGEMQSLATGVGDLKRVLTNVKTRGNWGEVQLEALLEQVLVPEQYDRNVATKGTDARVEFAVKLPGRSEDRSETVWLPIDAKFPQEDYLRLMEAQERVDPAAAEAASKALETCMRGCAKDICEKYLNPPKTTDFGILFLPTEGLYAEVMRRSGLSETIQREFRVVIAGPSTLWALVNSLQMGFHTLAIEKRSSEVWKLLGAVRSEFSKYGKVLGSVQKKLQEASSTIDSMGVRSRAMERQLRGVDSADNAALFDEPVPELPEEE